MDKKRNSTIEEEILNIYVVVGKQFFPHLTIDVFVCTGCAAPGDGQGAGVWCRAAVQPDPASAHVPHTGGPGEASPRQGKLALPVIVFQTNLN